MKENKKAKILKTKPSRTTQSLRSYWRQSFLLAFLFPLPCTPFTGVRPGRFPLAVSRAWARPLAVLPLPWARARPGPSPLWRPTEKILPACKFFPVFQIQRSEHHKAVNNSSHTEKNHSLENKVTDLERDLECVLERVLMVFFSSVSKLSSSRPSGPSSRSMSYNSPAITPHLCMCYFS